MVRQTLLFHPFNIFNENPVSLNDFKRLENLRNSLSHGGQSPDNGWIF